MYGCAGSLVHEQYVITAAHCTAMGSYTISHVKLGHADVNSRCSFDVEIKLMFTHPGTKFNEKFFQP